VYTLAHLSDLHLGPLPRGATFHNFAPKRIIGSLSWNLMRRKLHLTRVADAIADDIAADGPDHVAFTGDLVNIAAHAEFSRAAAWMHRLGAVKDVTFVPGNHDAYVRCAWDKGLNHLAPWMAGDMRLKETQSSSQIETPFPFIRLRKNIALIGLSTALPQPMRMAAGALGPIQLRTLAASLRDLRERGYARIVLIHHPPFPGLASERKALKDAAELQTVIVEEGAELLLHGHNHRHLLTPLQTRFGLAHAIGVPSASMGSDSNHTPAAWYRYAIVRSDGRWRTTVTVRAFDPPSATMVTGSEFVLST
jgi:3',5'-cyclic AMP phosphodiesterase CpdA